MLFRTKKTEMPARETALPGRDRPSFRVPERHHVNGHGLMPPYPEGLEVAMFGLGCFWGAERKFWQHARRVRDGRRLRRRAHAEPDLRGGVHRRTGHNEVGARRVRPEADSYEDAAEAFWESHNPTQGMRQGNDVGTQYRSGIYSYGEAQERGGASAAKAVYQRGARRAGHGEITTEILPAPEFYSAEDYHQQYLAKNPGGYCGLGGTGVSCPVGLGEPAAA